MLAESRLIRIYWSSRAVGHEEICPEQVGCSGPRCLVDVEAAVKHLPSLWWDHRRGALSVGHHQIGWILAHFLGQPTGRCRGQRHARVCRCEFTVARGGNFASMKHLMLAAFWDKWYTQEARDRRDEEPTRIREGTCHLLFSRVAWPHPPA